jgi:2'-5' RNA ligase
MRVAIYFTPPADDPLTALAAEWLGRDAFDNRAMRGRDSVVDPIVSEPARYGFHATLKAPFRLSDATSFANFVSAFTGFAHQQHSFSLGPLAIRRIGRFFALTPVTPPAALAELEKAVRTIFEPFRAPLSEADIERRKPHLLPPRQRENLQRWGYPHVGEDFRFHMTLTNSIGDDQVEGIETALKKHFATVLDRAVQVDGLALFTEPEPGKPFHIHAREPFADALHSTN